MSAGHESGLDLRRDDGTLDVSLNWIARNGEVHFTIEVNSQYGLSKTIVDFTAAQSQEVGGKFVQAGRQAGPAEGVVPASVAEVKRERGSPAFGWDLTPRTPQRRCPRGF